MVEQNISLKRPTKAVSCGILTRLPRLQRFYNTDVSIYICLTIGRCCVTSVASGACGQTSVSGPTSAFRRTRLRMSLPATGLYPVRMLWPQQAAEFWKQSVITVVRNRPPITEPFAPNNDGANFCSFINTSFPRFYWYASVDQQGVKRRPSAKASGGPRSILFMGSAKDGHLDLQKNHELDSSDKEWDP